MKHKLACAVVASLLALCAPRGARAESEQEEKPDSAEKAALALRKAYRACDRAAALQVATRAVVKQLIRKKCKPPPADSPDNLQFQGCKENEGSLWCSFTFEGGATNMRVAKRNEGYRVVALKLVAN